jgi:hypothetical protein
MVVDFLLLMFHLPSALLKIGHSQAEIVTYLRNLKIWSRHTRSCLTGEHGLGTPTMTGTLPPPLRLHQEGLVLLLPLLEAKLLQVG